MFCTVEQVRACNDKLSSSSDIDDTVIDDRIGEADSTLTVDLSALLSAAEITALGSSNKIINLLSTWKSVELCLARLFGAARQADQVSDIDYWRKKYNELLVKTINGDVSISETTYPIDYPTITTNRLKLFPTKGISGFEEGDLDDEF